MGIPPAQQATIFDSFVQSKGQSYRKYGGTGLGLAIARQLTEMLGGTVSLHSPPASALLLFFSSPKYNQPQKIVGKLWRLS